MNLNNIKKNLVHDEPVFVDNISKFFSFILLGCDFTCVLS